MIHYLLDTNICIYVIRRKPDTVIQRLRQVPVAEVGISTITLSELEYLRIMDCLIEKETGECEKTRPITGRVL